MSFSVTKLNTVLITPSEPTPSGHDLPLSILDRMIFINTYTETLHVFGEGKEAAKVIREAVAKALVPYYPVAGRIIAESDGTGGERRRVACTGEGVWFVEASAGCTLEDVGYFASYPLVIPEEQLLPSPPPGISRDGSSFMIQVTEFKCGGFTIGFRWSHVMFDGIGAGQFKMAIGEMARGLEQPSVSPLWCREALVRPPNPQPGTQPVAPTSIPYTAALEFETCTIDISLDSINKFKEQFTKETGGETCSTFDVITANLWQSRTRAMDIPSDTNVYVDFPANLRQVVQNKGIGSGYYGNCFYQVVIKAPGGKIATCSFSEIVMLIKEGKGRLTSRFSRWLEGDPHESPLQLIPDYESIYLTDWRRLGSSKADYGWGTPKHIVRCGIERPVNLCTILNSPSLVKGVRVLANCVLKEHLEAFRHEMNKMA